MSQKTAEEATEQRELFSDVQRDYYREFQQQEGIPVHTGYFVQDLGNLEIKPWSRTGGSGCYVNLFGEETWADNYLCEIAPGQSLKPQRHMFEEIVYVLSGCGATTFWSREGGPTWTLEWNEQSLFALPSNVGYQHLNRDASRPARLFAKTTLPAIFQYFGSRKFIFENEFAFEGAEKDFYSTEAKIYRQGPPLNMTVWSANFIPDVKAFDRMTGLQVRGAGGSNIVFHQPGLAVLNAHQSEFPVGTYKKAHAHPPGRSIIPITGNGYSLFWRPGREKEKQRVDWHPGSLFGVALTSLQGECWYHQHFNTGKEPARYLVLHVNPRKTKDKHIQIEYIDEEPEIRGIFESELAKSGLRSNMSPTCYNERGINTYNEAYM
ncbi:MAG: hypothetical protein HY673_06990 [Chloroflexi bacterium]|nr:hypothetical protein [Chloroflexota bacterium]